MLNASRTTPLRIRSFALTAALAASPTLAATPVGPDLAHWLAANTDIPASQVVITGPELVYSLDPLGPPASTGEVIALVRTEPLSADWGAAHGFQSWEANLLIDCAQGRMRQIRSASYPERNRKGRPTAEEPPTGWTSPEPNQPAMRLLSAACNPGFVWPLRHNLLTGAPKASNLPQVVATPRPAPAPPAVVAPPPVVVAATTTKPEAATPPRTTAATPTPTAPTPATTTMAPTATGPAAKPTPAISTSQKFQVQLGRGPSEEGAKKAIAAARKSLGPAGEKLTGSTETAEISRNRTRYTALLGGFPTAAAAAEACEALTKAGQACLVRNAPKS